MRALAYAFIVMAVVAALGNSAAAVVNARGGRWVEGVMHLVIAVAIGAGTFLGWYVLERQPRYRWRDGHDR